VSTRSTYDVVIVGGGPAGSATAIRLARRGHHVILLDREQFPRAKPCGECLNPAAVRELEELGVLSRLLALPHEILEGWRISAPSGRFFLGHFPSSAFGIAMQRSLLDAALLDEARIAGAEVRCGCRVADLHWEGREVRGVITDRGSGSERVRARLVIGADGLRSVVMRRLRVGRRAPRLRKVALTAHAGSGPDLGGRGELHITPGGCIGVAAVGAGRVNITVVVQASEARSGLAEGAEIFFDRAMTEHPRLREFIRQDEVLTTGPFDWPVRTAVASGALLVGDAAGYYDPFTGQGIFRALRGAAIAADSAHAGLSGDLATDTALRRYERERRRIFRPGERLQHLIEAVVSREKLFEVAARGLNAAPAVADRLVGVAGDLHPVRSLLDPRLLRALG
jgi:menaquinone-9 beta-reductase